MTIVRLQGLTKRYGATVAVDALDLEVRSGELLTLLGPSGCGKTTTLRMVGGFVEPDAGDIFFDDRVVTDVPPERRPTAMVFQSYALWPHMTVAQNVSFGLRVRHRPGREVATKVGQALELVGLTGMESRYPRQLSGGQQQRVALARALVVEPQVLLLDEPLSNLDAKLRVRMRAEVRELQKRVGITMLYVTHDQEEALSISDRVAVMDAGHIEQLATPAELFEHPRTPLVAAFIGQSNLLAASVLEVVDERYVRARLADGTVLCAKREGAQRAGDQVKLVIRAHQGRLAPAGTPNGLPGRLVVISYLGTAKRLAIETPVGRLLADVPADTAVSEGNEIWLELPADALLSIREEAP
jgi:ABC-type Fe3+/spermidine/putrescine transport system ATPase subunit